MKDILNDILKNITVSDTISVIKVVGTDKETTITTVSEDQNIIITGKLKNPHPEFIGTFGMPNLPKLKTILSFDEYDEKAKINVSYKTDGADSIPEGIHFESANGDFVNDYRFMLADIVGQKIRHFVITTPAWHADFEPSVASILRLKKQASANSELDKFKMVSENGDLKIYFGDPATHSGNFVFQPNVPGVTTAWKWPVKEIINVLSLAGDKTMKISNQGAVEITVDTGLILYQYYFPAHTK